MFVCLCVSFFSFAGLVHTIIFFASEGLRSYRAAMRMSEQLRFSHTPLPAPKRGCGFAEDSPGFFVLISNYICVEVKIVSHSLKHLN